LLQLKVPRLSIIVKEGRLRNELNLLVFGTAVFTSPQLTAPGAFTPSLIAPTSPSQIEIFSYFTSSPGQCVFRSSACRSLLRADCPIMETSRYSLPRILCPLPALLRPSCLPYSSKPTCLPLASRLSLPIFPYSRKASSVCTDRLLFSVKVSAPLLNHGQVF
jgi:hypothetical protein